MPLCLSETLCCSWTNAPTDESAGRFHQAPLPRLLRVMKTCQKQTGQMWFVETHPDRSTAELWGTNDS